MMAWSNSPTTHRRINDCDIISPKGNGTTAAIGSRQTLCNVDSGVQWMQEVYSSALDASNIEPAPVWPERAGTANLWNRTADTPEDTAC